MRGAEGGWRNVGMNFGNDKGVTSTSQSTRIVRMLSLM